MASKYRLNLTRSLPIVNQRILLLHDKPVAHSSYDLLIRYIDLRNSMFRPARHNPSFLFNSWGIGQAILILRKCCR